MAETCTNCGLPQDLCVCDDINMSEVDAVVEVEVEERTHNKKVTVIKNLDEYESIDINQLRSDLQNNFGCGGTVKEENQRKIIELQGDQSSNFDDYFQDNFSEVDVVLK